MDQAQDESTRAGGDEPAVGGRLPRRVTLRPGAPVLRRDAGCLQLGLDPGAAVVAETPEGGDWLRSLADGPTHVPASGVARELAGQLWGAGWLADADAWQADVARWPRLAAAAYARAPLGARAALTLRSAGRVGLDVDERWRPELAGLLAGNGLAVVDEGAAEPADVWLVGGAREPARGPVDRLLQAGTPHLLVRGGPAEVVVGPLVVPGRTACLRCEDAHRADLDPRWPLLLAQLPSGPATGPSAGPPTEPALLTLALAWAVRDLVSFVEGGRPAAWSSTVTVDATLSLPRRRWLRHPHCGCAWGELLATG